MAKTYETIFFLNFKNSGRVKKSDINTPLQ